MKSIIKNHQDLYCSNLPKLTLILVCFFWWNLANAADEFTYDFELEGLDQQHSVIDDLFTQTSILIKRKSETLISVSNLRSNLEADTETLREILRSEGYYNSEITNTFLRQENHFQIKLIVRPNSLYKYGAIRITYIEPEPHAELKTALLNDIGISSGDAARADPVIAAEATILNTLPRYGYPFAGQLKRDLVVDHQTEELNVHFEISTGNRRKMGNLTFQGHESVDTEFISQLATWPADSYFEQKYIDELRNRIIKSNLFSGVVIDITEQESDYASITVNLIEAKHRTIGTSAGYSTAEGIGGEVSWQHRNFMGDGKRLKITARASEIEQSFAGLMEIPHFKRLDQTLSLEGVFRRQNTDAFFAHVLETRAGIDRVITDELALLANIDLEYSDVEDAIQDQDFFLVSFPLGFRWDSSDNLLDPGSGYRASLIAAPSYAISDEKFKFLKTEFRASAYYPLTATENIVFALRTRLGSIFGVENETLPATSRFFSGGGGSIRGYGFQRVGPLAIDNNPLGGRSVNEFATELRWKFENNLGFVLFSEAGNVYESTTPKFNDFRYAAGIGARYSTGFGPVRLDVAFPLNKRTGDSSFQLYISLGQAF